MIWINFAFVPLQKKIVIENLVVEGYAAEGKCLSRIDNKVYFISGAVPGDTIDLLVTKNKSDWAEGIAQRIVKLSPLRITPKCQHFGAEGSGCGGCKWQMLDYAKQLEYKQQQVQDTLQRIGRVKDAEYLPIKGCASEYAYRNKLEFTFSNKRYLTHNELNKEDISPMMNVLGYHAPRLFDKIIHIESCDLMGPFQNEIRNAIYDYAIKHQLSFYDHWAHTGLLRNLLVRESTIGETLVNVVFSKPDKAIEPMMEFIYAQFPNITSLHYTINGKRNDTLYDQEIICYKGKGYIEEKLEDFIFKISPKSFFQTNTQQGEVLYGIAREFAQLTGKEILYDLYCGTGSIGIFCSSLAAKVIGVETVADAIEDAKWNADKNNLTNSSWYSGDVIDVCDSAFFETNGYPDVIICDPPRAGMHATLVEKLLEIAAPRIVYVSCNPATQARDLALLQSKYVVKKVQAVDMFPQTHHVESVALLELA